MSCCWMEASTIAHGAESMLSNYATGFSETWEHSLPHHNDAERDTRKRLPFWNIFSSHICGEPCVQACFSLSCDSCRLVQPRKAVLTRRRGYNIVTQSSSGPSGRPDRQVVRDEKLCCLLEGKHTGLVGVPSKMYWRLMHSFPEGMLLYDSISMEYRESVLENASSLQRKLLLLSTRYVGCTSRL